MDASPLPPPDAFTKTTVQLIAQTPVRTDAQWGRPIFRAPQLTTFAPRRKVSVFPQRPFKGRVRDKRAA